MAKHQMILPSGETFDCDFSPDEIERRASEVLRRCCGMKPTFNMESGQPLDGEQLSDAELKRRGYR